MEKRNKIMYWAATVLLSLGMFSGGLAQLFKAQPNVDGIVHLGYPVYLTTILGVWKVLGVIVILIPRLPLLKEWAYAGFFFAMTGAVISHIALRDSFLEVLPSLMFAVLTIVSWYFRPESRKLVSAEKALA